MYKNRLVSYVLAIVLAFTFGTYGNIFAAGNTEAAADASEQIVLDESTSEQNYERIDEDNASDEEQQEADENTDKNIENNESQVPSDELNEDINLPEDEAENNQESPVPDENVETETLNDADSTPSAEPTEAPDVNLDELLGTGIKYSELTDEEKAEAQEIYRIRDSVFADCESAGMDFEKSTVVGLIIQNASLTANEYMTILTKYPDEESAVEEIKEYGNFKYSVPRLKIESNPVCKEQLISGKNAASILQGAVLYDILLCGDIAGYSELSADLIEEMLSEEQLYEFESAMQILSPDIQQFGLDDGISLAAEDDGEYYNDVSRYPQAPFSYDKNGSEIFNESTGSLGYVLPGLSLDGSNGFGLNISAKYETSESSPYDITTSVFNTTAPTYSKQITPLNIAAGWSFEGISSIHVFDTSKYRNDYILKTADGTYTLKNSDIKNENRTEITINRSIYFTDIKLYKDTSYESEESAVSAYSLTYRDGRVEYFDEYGRLLMSQNRFGDQIKYSYWSSMNYEDQDLGQDCSIIEIKDTCDRKIIIERGEMQNNRQTITLSVYSGDDIIPGTTQIFNVRKIEVPVKSKDTTEYTTVLESYIDREGQKTEFEYIEDDVSSVRLSNHTWINQSFFVLTKVKHPTGANTIYEYAKSDRDYSKPQYLMLTKRCDVIGTSEENLITYSYDGKCFRNTRYTVTETNADGLCTEHRFVPCYEHTNTGFNDYGLSIQSNNSSGEFTLKGSDTTYYMDGETKKYVSKTEYESYFYRTYPTKTKNTIYDEEQNSIDIITNSEYNENRDLVKSWDAYANGDTSNTEHMTEYTYDDTYHIMTGKTYKKDANTTVREEYSLTSNSKAVASKKVYENDSLVSREDYAYADVNSANPSAATSYASGSKTIVTTTEYQNKSLPTKQTVDGVSVIYTYDALGRNTSVTDGNGNTTRMTYDNLGRVITQTNAEGNIVTNTYPAANADGTISSNTLYVNTERGNDVKYTYDALGKILTVQDLDANLTTASYSYDDMGRVTQVYDGNSNRHGYIYDIQGRKTQYNVMTSSSTPSYVEVYQYDEVSDNETSCVKTIVGVGNDRVYKAEYTDKYGNKVKETAGDGSDISETTYTYNYIGEQISSTTPNGETYNISTTAQANSGKKAVTTDPLGHTTTVIYDMLGREIEAIDGNGNHAYKEYDSAGRVVSEKTKISGKDAIKKYKYDNNGNVLKESIKNNKAGEETSYRNIYYKYDRMNRLISTNTDEEGETKYTYDEIGNILTMTTGVTDTDAGVTTSYQYSNDTRSLLVKLTDPMGYTESYTYDGNGNVLTKTDKNGTVTTNTYNGINNILSSTASARGGGGSQDGAGESTISYEYMQWGSLVKSITNATGTVTYGYNNKGMVISEASTADNTSKSYIYDKNGNQTNLTISQNGSQLINQTNTFNSVGQLTQVYDAKNSKTLASYTYDNVGNVTSKETAGGMQKTTYSYNESNLLTKVQNMSIGNQQTGQFGTYSSYAYEYYLDGSKEKETDNIGKTKGYYYDGAGRLKAERYDNQSGLDSWANVYTYDARGNRNNIRYSKGNKAYIDSFIEGISSSAYDEETVFESIPDRIKNTKSASTSYSYDKNNRLIQQIWYSDDMWVHDKRTYTYDKNGNLTAKNTNIYYYDYAPEDAMTVEYMDKDESYSYNSFNILSGYSASGYNVESVNASYIYDPTGQRISKTVNGVATNHIWDNSGNIVVENDKIYNRGLGGEILSARGGVGSQDGAGDLSYSYNGHGDTTNLTRQSSGVALAMTATYEYDAFGNCNAKGGEADNNPFRYNGQYTDEETGLIYLRNRYYDPSIGRFTQEDPAKDGLNWYVYCDNDPVNFADIFGLDPVPLRETAQRLGAQVTYDPISRCAIVDFGCYGGYQFYSLDSRDDDGAFGQWEYVDGEYTIVAMIEEGRIEYDFGIVDNRYYWDEEYGNYVTVSLFDKGYQGYYQRIAINGASITWESVNYSDFNTWYGGQYGLSAGRVFGSYVDRENMQNLRNILAVADAYPDGFPFSDYISIASYFYGVFGYEPEYKLFEDDYQILFHNKVYFFDRYMNYKYSADD